jgi:hypothetical protein
MRGQERAWRKKKTDSFSPMFWLIARRVADIHGMGPTRTKILEIEMGV